MKEFCSSFVVLVLIGVIFKIICWVYGVSVKPKNIPMFDTPNKTTEHNGQIQEKALIDDIDEDDEEFDCPTVMINQNVIQILKRFDGSVKEEIPLPPIPKMGLMLGKAKDSDIRINEEVISRHHCRIGEDSEGIYIQDEDSTNGIYYSTDITKRVKQIEVKMGEIFYIANIPVKICRRNLMEPIYDMSKKTKAYKKDSDSAEQAFVRI